MRAFGVVYWAFGLGDVSGKSRTSALTEGQDLDIPNPGIHVGTGTEVPKYRPTAVECLVEGLMGRSDYLNKYLGT